MSTLVILIPSRPRLSARSPGRDEPELVRAGVEYAYALTPDGLSVQAQGRSPAALLPKADTVVAALSEADVSWHRVTLPKAPPGRLRAALVGVIEEALLEDPDSVHLAVAPQSVAGEPAWIAAVNRPWLRGELAALEAAQVFVDRVVPAAWPDDPPVGHFAEALPEPGGPPGSVTLTWAHSDGVALIRLKGSLARALLPLPLPDTARWSAEPAAVAAAEQWLGQPVAVMTAAERALQAARSLWNLRQFDLARRNRGMRALRDAWREFMSPAWRPARIGLAALIVVNILGLNLLAWQQQSAMADKRSAMQSVLRSTYPQVRAVLDAPTQMQRETDRLRALAGKPGAMDLEPMLQAAAAAWPADRPPVEALGYEPGQLSLSANGWGAPQIEQFRKQLHAAGWQVEASDGRLVMRRAEPRAGAAS